ncbi:MAG: cysteine hydrolase [Cyanobacteriota bacterium]|nr:cysteine hydrolase [Cyanobacteriota bacterium]
MVSLPARPYPYPLPNLRHIALVVIDMQRDFLEPGGFGALLGNPVERLQPAIPVIQRLLQRCRQLGLMIVHTQEGHQPDLSDCPSAKRERGNLSTRIGDVGPMGRVLVLGEPGNAFVASLQPLPGELVITKPGKGAFYQTPLHEALQQRAITHLLFAGVTTEVCVQTTMREANDRGYYGLLIEDATESYFPAFKAATIEMIVAQGAIIGWVTSSDCLLSALRV